jgi:hypothetical protein
MKDEALKLAIQSLESCSGVPHWPAICATIVTIKQALAAQPAVQEPKEIAELVEGMEVSIDVSTGDHDSGNRLFGTVTLAQENQGSKHGLILLVQNPEANFKTATPPAAQPAPVQEPWGFHIQFNNGKDATFKGLNHLAECEAHLESGETITMIYTTPPAAPVQYQRREIGEGDFVNCTKEQYEYAEGSPQMDTRVILTPPAAQPAVQEPVARVSLQWLAEMILSDCGHSSNYTPLLDRVKARIEQWERANSAPTPPAAAVPDAIHHTDLSEHPQYIEGWNDCRAEMLKGMKP